MNPSFQEALKQAKKADKSGLFDRVSKIEGMRASIEGMQRVLKQVTGKEREIIDLGIDIASTAINKERYPCSLAMDLIGICFKTCLEGERHAQEQKDKHEETRRRLTPDVVRLANMGEEPDEKMLEEMMECEHGRHFYRGVADAHNKILLLLGGMTLALAPDAVKEHEKELENAEQFKQ